MKRAALTALLFLLFVGCATSMQQAMEDAYRKSLGEPEVDVSYDQMSDQAVHKAGAFVLAGTDSTSEAPAVVMNLMAGCEGKPPCPGEDIALTFLSTDDEWKFLDNHQVLMMAGNEQDGIVRFSPDEVVHDGEVRASQYSTVTETVMFAMSREELERMLAPSGPVKLRIGLYDYKFPPEVEKMMSEYTDSFATTEI